MKEVFSYKNIASQGSGATPCFQTIFVGVWCLRLPKFIQKYQKNQECTRASKRKLILEARQISGGENP